MRWRRHRATGFTLVELMVVVAMVGVLSVLAVYGVRKYAANAKTVEARNSLGALSKSVAANYERETAAPTVLGPKVTSTLSRRLCASASTTVPATATSIKGRKYQSSIAEWKVDAATNAGFACLKFEIDAPQYYMYSYGITGAGTSPGDTFTAAAQGDLNGDGVLSLFQITGTINASRALNTAPNMVEVRGDE